MSHATALSGILGWVAAALVLTTFCCKRMVSLRIIAIASNLAFIGYGYLAGLGPILALHLIMLPLNGWRLRGALVEERSGCRSAMATTPRPRGGL